MTHRHFIERLLESQLMVDLAYGFCDILNNLADKLDNFASNMQIDESVVETIPCKIVEKKRMTKKPIKSGFNFYPIKKLIISENQIKVDSVLDGFDEECLREGKKRIIISGKFIMNNAETKLEINLAFQLAKMFHRQAIIITDTYLTSNERYGAYFQPKSPTEEFLSNVHSYIGLDIMALIKNDIATLVNILAHETYHAWQFYKGNTEYSVIDETRAWNAGLSFSNKYRAMNGIPFERIKNFTTDELVVMAVEYRNAFNVNIRFGPADNIIEKIGYSIANLIEDASDTVEGWTEKIMEKTSTG